ncbi:MAG: sulfatase-like hydrolase/transferase, partial [Candidatus Omnitrophica bacterium]|nr:sulfatase-like hydrolase/transferase [Candidatus Omnitrophota bacterium]MBU1929763.1 sulfatase-like hydrolase/transferase [Candidatus Omnitrophota bacterium]
DSLSLSGKYKDYNVILVILDAMRTDHLSCYGYAKETSPNIDQLAKEGIIFTNAFSQSHNTLPGVASIFSSLYPTSHGMEHIFKDKFPPNVYTLAEILNIYGYKTAWFGSLNDPYSGSAVGLLSGFDEKYNLKPDYTDLFSFIKGHNKEQFLMTIHSYSAHELHLFDYKPETDSKKFNALLEDLKKFFIKKWEYMRYACENNTDEFDKIFGIGWSKKHVEYFMQPYSRDNLNKIIALQDSRPKKNSLAYILRVDSIWSFYASMNNEDFLSIISLLDNVIYQLDKNLIGGLIAALKEANINDKTIIIITADHGNAYREHGLIFGHGQFLYDEIIRVPLIFYLPHLNKAVKINSLAQNIDIMPTILDLLGILSPHNVQGICLTGLIDGKPGALVNDYVFAKSLIGSFAIRSKRWKLIRKNINAESIADGDELYDILKDPLEKDNLINIELGMAKILKSELKTKIFSLPVYNKGNSEFIPEIDSESRERIKKTGYW